MFIWNWGIGLAMGTAVILYLRGWRQQPPADGYTLLPQHWRIVTFVAAGVVLALALFSPLHVQATTYFHRHVLQRLLLVAVVPCLFFSGNPLPILYTGLPARLQDALARLPQRRPLFCHLVTRLTNPVISWFLFVAAFWLWHDVQINRLLLQAGWVHRLENVTLLGTAVGYWWHIMNAWPRWHAPMPPLWRVGYAALGATPVKLVGLVLLFSPTAVYHYPAEVSFYNLQITDQSLGAAIEWAVGGIVFTWTAVLLMRSWLKQEDDKPALPESAWATKEMMLAPGFKEKGPIHPNRSM
ncbi:MAG: cytochrome c oxidase assembly protein [Anaerolineaceae bacterium]|nr:cytochrome c oxidase assembly protein [Anaerolineaceae bacterium]